MLTKSANLYARIEPEVKEKAERILSILGIPASRSVDISTLSEVEFNEELKKGYADMQARRTKNAEKAFADIRKDYGL